MKQVLRGTIKITNPPMDIDNMEYTELVVLVGKNGSGKTLVLKSIWALGTIGFLYLKTGKNLQSLAQFVWNNTFDSQDFTGEISFDFENGPVGITLEDGTVVSAYCGAVDSGDLLPPKYMSTTLRLFSAIKTALALLDAVGEEKFLESYRIYDLVMLQQMRMRFSEKVELPKIVKAHLHTMLETYKPNAIQYADGAFWGFDDSGSRKDLATLGNGEQALINMTIASI